MKRINLILSVLTIFLSAAIFLGNIKASEINSYECKAFKGNGLCFNSRQKIESVSRLEKDMIKEALKNKRKSCDASIKKISNIYNLVRDESIEKEWNDFFGVKKEDANSDQAVLFLRSVIPIFFDSADGELHNYLMSQEKKERFSFVMQRYLRLNLFDLYFLNNGEIQIKLKEKAYKQSNNIFKKMEDGSANFEKFLNKGLNEGLEKSSGNLTEFDSSFLEYISFFIGEINGYMTNVSYLKNQLSSFSKRLYIVKTKKLTSPFVNECGDIFIHENIIKKKKLMESIFYHEAMHILYYNSIESRIVSSFIKKYAEISLGRNVSIDFFEEYYKSQYHIEELLIDFSAIMLDNKKTIDYHIMLKNILGNNHIRVDIFGDLLSLKKQYEKLMQLRGLSYNKRQAFLHKKVFDGGSKSISDFGCGVMPYGCLNFGSLNKLRDTVKKRDKRYNRNSTYYMLNLMNVFFDVDLFLKDIKRKKLKKLDSKRRKEMETLMSKIDIQEREVSERVNFYKKGLR